MNNRLSLALSRVQLCSRLFLMAAAVLTATPAAAAEDIDFRRCRALPDAAARLACYDALPLATPTAAAGIAGGNAARVNAAPPAGVAAFGLPESRNEIAEIASSLAGRFEGWGPRTQFRLVNGQLWQVSDDSSGVYDLQDPRVKVRRATFGTFMLDIDGARRSPRVRRVE